MTTAELDLATATPVSASNSTMKALVYHGPGKFAWEDKPRPGIQQPNDAIVRITTSTICGTDLHILKGDLPAVTDGRILGHEGIGIVEQIGSGVTEFQLGDKVIVSCVTACLKCDFCKRGMYSHCRHGGWILGYTHDGTQAEYVRIPQADGSLYHFPPGGDEESLVMLSDIFPTGFECGVLNGQVKPGDTVAIVGAGPVGLSVLLTAQFYSPAAILMIDLDDKRLTVAKTFGATTLINSSYGQAAHQVMELTEGAGVDVAIEAVGKPLTWQWAVNSVRRGGTVNFFGGCPNDSKVNLDTALLHYSEITCKASFHHTPEYVRKAMDLVCAGHITASVFVNSEEPLANLLEVMRHLMSHNGHLKTAIVP